MRLGEPLMQMHVGAVEERIAVADHGNVLAGVELGARASRRSLVEGDERVAIAGVGLGQLGGDGIVEADELGVGLSWPSTMRRALPRLPFLAK